MTKRRSAGEGSVYPRKERNGKVRWVGSVEAGWAPGGKRVRRVVYGATKKEVVAKLKTIVREREQGIRTEDRRTVAEFLQSWLEEVVKVSKRPSTYRTYLHIARTHLVPTIGHLQLTRLREQDVQGMIQARLRVGVTPGTVRAACMVLHAALGQAETWRLVPRNVAKGAQLPAATRRTGVALTASEVAQLLTAAEGDPWEALYAVAVYTGLRQGEILGLRWADVDWEGQVIHVAGQATREAVHAATKSVSGVRDVTFGPELRAALTAHHARQLAVRSLAGGHWEDNDLVFANTRGRPRHPTPVREDFYALCVRAGIQRPVHFHDLRHTYASLLDSAGVTGATAQALLGHGDGAQTRHYQHAYDADKALAATLVERMVSGL